MNNILILSHTRANSDFKIGSHHYACGLSKLNNNVFYSGIPETIFHRVLKEKKNSLGTYKLNSEVNHRQISAIFPLTFPMSVLTKIINPIFFKYFVENKKLVDVKYNSIICDSPFFFPFIDKFTFDNLYYRPTDDYVSMVGNKAELYERKMCEYSTLIICTSKTVAGKITDRYLVSDDKITVIENGYDSECFYKIETNKEERKNAVYIGALDYRFDFHALSTLAEEKKDIAFDIYGPIEKKYKKIVEDIERLGNVNFYGKVDYLKTNEIMNKYKVGLLLLKDTPSNRGRSPMKLWEYLASGLNVLYANIDNIKNASSVFEYTNHVDLISKFSDALNCNDYIEKSVLEYNSWSEKVVKLNDIINKKHE